MSLLGGARQPGSKPAARAKATFGIHGLRSGSLNFLISLAVGVLVGGLYALLRVRSPAPPLVALVGLLGIVIGEQSVSFLMQPHPARPASTAVLKQHAADD